MSRGTRALLTYSTSVRVQLTAAGHKVVHTCEAAKGIPCAALRRPPGLRISPGPVPLRRFFLRSPPAACHARKRCHASPKWSAQSPVRRSANTQDSESLQEPSPCGDHLCDRSKEPATPAQGYHASRSLCPDRPPHHAPAPTNTQTPAAALRDESPCPAAPTRSSPPRMASPQPRHSRR